MPGECNSFGSLVEVFVFFVILHCFSLLVTTWSKRKRGDTPRKAKDSTKLASKCSIHGLFQVYFKFLIFVFIILCMIN